MQKERMGFPEENNWTMTIVTNIYIYIYRQAMAFEYKEGRDREKKKWNVSLLKATVPNLSECLFFPMIVSGPPSWSSSWWSV